MPICVTLKDKIIDLAIAAMDCISFAFFPIESTTESALKCFLSL